MTDVILPLLRHAQNLPALRHSLRLWDCHAFRPLLLLPDNDVQEGVLPVLGHGIHRGLELNETRTFAELFFNVGLYCVITSSSVFVQLCLRTQMFMRAGEEMANPVVVLYVTEETKRPS